VAAPHGELTMRTKVLAPTTVALGVIGVGIALRLMLYASNRSLWLDESLLAPDVAERSFAGLWKPLDNGQAAPIGFLRVEETWSNGGGIMNKIWGLLHRQEFECPINDFDSKTNPGARPSFRLKAGTRYCLLLHAQRSD
jgi:hypothetical protein